ncbi:hypothetical protein [Thalassovita sp.]|uniref:hypothetical protein n=1 Tax=Thalassovita sp. TaxID=1979401 RepID=UPI002B270B03|nr:hypothetical protein [Thalassovita sp.]
MHRKFATFMVYATHDRIEAMTLATRIVVKKGGVMQLIPVTALNRNGQAWPGTPHPLSFDRNKLSCLAPDTGKWLN